MGPWPDTPTPTPAPRPADARSPAVGAASEATGRNDAAVVRSARKALTMVINRFSM